MYTDLSVYIRVFTLLLEHHVMGLSNDDMMSPLSGALSALDPAACNHPVIRCYCNLSVRVKSIVARSSLLGLEERLRNEGLIHDITMPTQNQAKGSKITPFHVPREVLGSWRFRTDL